MNLIDLLEKGNNIPAYVSGSFADDENFPDPCWVCTNMNTTNYFSDNGIEYEVLRYTVALYSSDPAGLRETVKAKQKELIKNGILCSGIVDWKTKNPVLWGYGFECDVIQKF